MYVLTVSTFFFFLWYLHRVACNLTDHTADVIMCPQRIWAASLHKATLCYIVGTVMGKKCINNREKYKRDKTNEWVTIRIMTSIEDGWKLQKYFLFLPQVPPLSFISISLFTLFPLHLNKAPWKEFRSCLTVQKKGQKQFWILLVYSNIKQFFFFSTEGNSESRSCHHQRI